MGLPLILYDLATILNPSFEDDADATSPPTGWDAAAGTEVIETDTAEQFDKGSAHGKLASCRLLNVAAQQEARADQTIVPATMPPVGTKMGLVCVVKGAAGTETARIVLQEQDSGHVDQGATQKTAQAVTTSWAGLDVIHTVADATSVEFRCNVNPQGFAPEDEIWVDTFLLGRAVDFTAQEFVSATVITDDRAALNAGAGAWEGVEIGEPMTRVQVVMEDIDVGGAVDLMLKAFRGFVGTSKRFAFWMDRDDHTNQGRHFSECILSPGSLSEKIPPGAYRYSTTLDFIAPKEWQAQEVD